MSSIERRGSETELRLDYEAISAGTLVIVIHGVPSTLDDVVALPAGALKSSSSAANGHSRDQEASAPLSEATRPIREAAAYAPVLTSALVRAAWRGQEARASELAAATVEDAAAEDESRAAAVADYARAVLYNGLGRYDEGLAAAQRACSTHEAIGGCPWALVELVEAAARAKARTVAAAAFARLDELTRESRADWASGIRARSAAVLSEGAKAEGHYQDAIELLGQSAVPAHTARAQLLYGEWLRRENRRVDARVQLRAAHETFERLGAEAFAERALRELHATGETARKRTNDTRSSLTPQEAEIARLARDGYSNPEIGAQLYLSPRTVQYHLRKVFQKLDLTSRNQLVRIPSERLAA